MKYTFVFFSPPKLLWGFYSLPINTDWMWANDEYVHPLYIYIYFVVVVAAADKTGCAVPHDESVRTWRRRSEGTTNVRIRIRRDGPCPGLLTNARGGRVYARVLSRRPWPLRRTVLSATFPGSDDTRAFGVPYVRAGPGWRGAAPNKTTVIIVCSRPT